MGSILCLLLATFLWGTSFVAGKYALDVADAPLVVLARFLWSALFWLPTFRRIAPTINKSQWYSLSSLAFLMIPLTFLLQLIGLQYTSASSAAVMMGFSPLMVVLMGWLIWREHLNKVDVLLSVVALMGVILVMGWPKDLHFLGAFLVLLSSIVVAIWLRWSKIWMQTLAVSHFTALTTVLGTALLIPCTLFLTQHWRVYWSWSGILAVIYLGVGCSLLASWCWNKGMQQTKANLGGLFLTLEPIFGVMFASWLLQETWDLSTKVGIVLVILPVVIASVLPLYKMKRV